MTANIFEERLKQYSSEFHPVVPFEKNDTFFLMDFTDRNHELTDEILKDTQLFTRYIHSKLEAAGARYGIGGYDEHRTIYSRSQLFGPSPTTCVNVQDRAKASSRWQKDKEAEPGVEEETVAYLYADPSVYGQLKEYGLKNRSEPALAETALGEALQSKQLSRYTFRRQYIIGRYIADFVCLEQKLVIEVDGLIHQLPEDQLSDTQRTKALNALGFKVLRFSHDEVLHNLTKVLDSIIVALEDSKKEKENMDLSFPAGGQVAAPRRLHLGIDIWGKPYTKVMAPMDGIVHSFAFNNAFGDYGATIILSHNLEGMPFYTLYGHLSLNSLKNLQEGQPVKKGDVFTEFGIPFENGQWPPHLHFQIILDMQGMKGDYPGVCAYPEREKYLANCPDPDLILGLLQYAGREAKS